MASVMSEKPKIVRTRTILLRLLRESMPGEWLALAASLALTLAALGSALLLPWPIKLVLDCVVGNQPVPPLIRGFIRIIGEFLTDSAQRKISLLVALGSVLVGIQLLTSGLALAANYLLSASSLRMVFRLR